MGSNPTLLKRGFSSFSQPFCGVCGVSRQQRAEKVGRQYSGFHSARASRSRQHFPDVTDALIVVEHQQRRPENRPTALHKPGTGGRRRIFSLPLLVVSFHLTTRVQSITMAAPYQDCVILLVRQRRIGGDGERDAHVSGRLDHAAAGDVWPDAESLLWYVSRRGLS